MLSTASGGPTEFEEAQRLRKRSELLEVMGSMAHIGAWSFDVATGQGMWTAEVARIHEVDPDLQPNAQLGLSFYEGESRQKLEAAIQEATTLGKPYDLELELLTATGTRKWVRTSGFPITVGGRVEKLYGAIQDITERKQAEEELRRLNLELERRVSQRTAQLEAANQELESFASYVSHDLHAPLRAIGGSAGILQQDYAEALGADGLRALQVIRGETDRLGQFIDALLAFCRVRCALDRPARISMTELVREVLAECIAQAPDRRVELQVDSLLPACGNSRLVRQVLVNLLSNAFKYTRPREVARIGVGSRAEGNEVVYWIRDNGVGFDPTGAGRLFRIFQRLHSDTQFEGTGVGLALAARIVRGHGGRIWAEAAFDQGATFYFTLPIDAPQP